VTLEVVEMLGDLIFLFFYAGEGEELVVVWKLEVVNITCIFNI
jgi:hypothetical protein